MIVYVPPLFSISIAAIAQKHADRRQDIMQDIMSIDRFHAALASSKSDTPLMIALRQVKTIK